MKQSNARVVIINHAMNDKVYTPVDKYKKNLQQLAQIAINHGKQVIFETPNPDYWGGLEPYMAAMKTVAMEFNLPVIDQFAYLMSYLDGRPVQLICPDNTHPSEQAYEMKGRFAAERFLEFTTKPAPR